mmetsp:Transcript_137/g.407  ORF Transcript_137/g.407 Transcript_137/m.407 type:complete len:632 (-) Transcript_137:125-2020(-)
MGQCSCTPFLAQNARPWRFIGLESCDTYQELHSVKCALEGEHTVLLRGRWLASIAATSWLDWFLPTWEGVGLGGLPRCQDLPADAVWDTSTLLNRLSRKGSGSVRIVAISHCWRSREHPDPQGRHLRTLGKALQLWYSHFDSYSWELAIFLDWCSIPQLPRSAEDETRYEAALEHIHLWYTHPMTDVWLLPAFSESSSSKTKAKSPHDRAWIAFELALASLSPVRSLVLDLSHVHGSMESWDALELKCTMPRAPVKAPAALAIDLQGKGVSVAEDRPFLCRAYAQTCQSLLAYSTEFHFTNMQWAAEEIAQLAQALPLCTSLQMLFLADNLAGDHGLQALSETLPLCPSLHTLEIQRNGIGPDGVAALARALPRCPSIVRLDLGGNLLGEYGIDHITRVLPQCRLLAGLILDSNGINESGCHRLAAVLSDCPALHRLSLCDNDIGDKAAVALAHAVPKCRSLRHLLLDQSSVGDEGCAALALALVKCRGIQTLRIAGNRFGVLGATSLAEALPGATSLARLAIGNSLSEERVRIVVDAWVAAGRPLAALVIPGLKTSSSAEMSDSTLGKEACLLPSSWLPAAASSSRPSDLVLRSCLCKSSLADVSTHAAVPEGSQHRAMRTRAVSWSDVA